MNDITTCTHEGYIDAYTSSFCGSCGWDFESEDNE